MSSSRMQVLLVGAVVTVLLAAVVLVVVRNRSGIDESANRISLRLPIPVVDTAFSPYYLAEDMGLFEQQSLRVTIEPGSPELNPVKMVGSGMDQFGVLGGPELLLTARAKGVPLVAIALIHKDADFSVIITKRESGLTTIEQLKELDVGFFYGHISTDVLRMLFNKNGVMVNEVDVGFNYSRFLDDQIPAQWAFRTTAGITLPARGVKLNFISPATYGIRTQGHVIVTTEEMIQQHPDVVKRFLNAVLDGVAAAIADHEAAVGAAIKRDREFSREIGMAQMSVYDETIRRNHQLGWLSLEDMETTKQQMVSIGLISEDLEVSTAFTTRFVEAYHNRDQ